MLGVILHTQLVKVLLVQISGFHFLYAGPLPLHSGSPRRVLFAPEENLKVLKAQYQRMMIYREVQAKEPLRQLCSF